MAIPGYQLGKAIQEALGLPPETNLIQIRIGLGEAVEVLCRYYPDAEAMERCLHVLQAYQLVPAGAPIIIEDTLEPLHAGAEHTAEKRQQSLSNHRRC